MATLNHNVKVDDEPKRSWTGRFDPDDETDPVDTESWGARCTECRWQGFGETREEAEALADSHKNAPVLNLG